MPLSSDQADGEADWEITPDGLYMATRHLLLRRGYCCANRCYNCPYINWRANPAWQHAPATAIQCTRVSPKAIDAVHQQLAYHEQKLAESDETAQAEQQKLIEHYRLLLECWE